MHRSLRTALLTTILLVPTAAGAQRPGHGGDPCSDPRPGERGHAPAEREMRCRYGIDGPGRFGLLSYVDLPVYQPATPMPGTHLVGGRGHARPLPGESYEAWEWRMLRAEFDDDVRRVRRELEVLDPMVAGRLMTLEARLREEGIAFRRRETWRSPERQAFLFQQGRTRPGPLATSTLTSWHSQVDERGAPAGRAADYDVAPGGLWRFHELAAALGLTSFGADSNDPGHVFLADADEFPRAEISRLLTLPRVPEVTLATGLPVDRRPPPDGAEGLRERCLEFANLPFVPYPAASIAGGTRPPRPLTRLSGETELTRTEPAVVPAPPPAPAGVGDGRGERR